MVSLQQFCTFLLDGEWFGVPVADVQEVFQNRDMTPVPLAPDRVAGMINLRGKIVFVIDLRRRLGMPDRLPGQPSFNVVVRGHDGVVSLQVDEIGDVIEADHQTVENLPETLQGIAREVIQRIYKLPDRLLLVLDIDRIAPLT